MQSRTEAPIGQFPRVQWKKQNRTASQEFYREMEFLDLVPGLLWRSDEKGSFTYLNRAWLEFRGRTLEEEIELGWLEGVHPDDLKNALNVQAQAFNNKKPFVRHFRLLASDKQYHWIKDCGSPIFEQNGEVEGFAGSALDFTEVYQDIEKQQTLLRETHHRVKNNLQILSSLLSLQSQQISGDTARATLQDCQNRVHVIVLLHEKLFQNESTNRLNFSEYVSELTEIVMSSYDRKLVGLKLEIEPVSIDQDKIIPCGLIINELLSNSLKYAFPNQDAGEISVRFHPENEHFVLEISDHGVGLRKDIQIYDSKTLGLRLVSALAKQLGGELIVDRNGGTKISVRFPR
jgi:PAS domain S-box-containing protein